jgi:hypothetical protein
MVMYISVKLLSSLAYAVTDKHSYVTVCVLPMIQHIAVDLPMKNSWNKILLLLF